MPRQSRDGLSVHQGLQIRLEGVRFRAPVVHGDTLYAYTQALGDEDGVVTLRHWGVNQRGEVVVELRRRVRRAGADD